MLEKRSPDEFSEALEAIEEFQSRRPPVEKWQPSREVNVDISIDKEGKWFYQGRPMERKALVKLFSSIVRKEGENYYLVTPVEKARLKVADVPFVIVNWEYYLDERQQAMVVVHSNIGHQVVISEDYPLVLKNKTIEGQVQQVPYVKLGNGLEARIRRSVYYQMIDHGEQVGTDSGTSLIIHSDGLTFELGKF